MKRVVSIAIILCIVFGLCGCSGNVRDVKIAEYTSEKYTDQEIEAAIEATKKYFEDEFDGCKLLELEYVGDDKLYEYVDFAERVGSEDVIAFVSSFYVGFCGGDGSLETNETYESWVWILAKDENGNWVHIDHGY